MPAENTADLVQRHWPTPPSDWQASWLQLPVLKRTLDLFCAGGLTLLLLPLLVTIAALVKLTSPGPVFYRGLRTGRFARPFRIFKFRTMVDGAEKLGGSTTGKNDARVTAVGAFLRKFKLDELPQLFNVLSGEMSLVGPRPEVYEYTTLFASHEQVILAVPPGITDLSSLHFIDLQAHVGGENPDEVFRRQILPIKNQLRVHYACNHSILLDLRILFATAMKLVYPSLSTQWVRDQFPVNEPTENVSIADRPSAVNPGQAVGRLGMGCWAAGGHGWGAVDDQQSIAAIQAAWDAGVRHFDTADVYGLGHSEQILSQALGANRHQAVIATKFGVRFDAAGKSWKDLSRDYCHHAVEQSLRRLRLESLPILYAHWPDNKTPIAELMETFNGLRKAGKIQAVGLSNFSASQLREAMRYGDVEFVQFEFSLLQQERWEDLRWLNTQSGTTVVTWGSLAKGLLANKFTAETSFSSDDTRSRDPLFQGERFVENLKIAQRLAAIAERNGLLPVQVALLFVLHTWRQGCALFGAKSLEQVQQNVATLQAQLSAADYAELCQLATSNQSQSSRAA